MVQNKGKKALGAAAAHFLFIMLSLMCVIPILMLISISLSDNGEILRRGYSIIPRGFNFEAYKYIFKDASKIVNAYKITFFSTVAGTLCSMLCTVLLAYVISRRNFAYRKIVSFIIMFTIPLAFTGGFIALLITGFDISVVSLVGFVMLCGIIVNNGIVLVDYINQLRLDGKERTEAIVEAGKTRMRPILITALTTVLGLSVMALGIGTGAEMMQPLAVVCIGGLLYATVMTLYIVPAIYDIFNRKELRKVEKEDLIVIDD